jgi:anti-sigma-K factor RskA
MTAAAHSEVKGNAGAYVLGSLDADERTAFEAHLSTCAECAAEVRSLRRVADALAHSVPQRTPSPDLRQRVLDSIAATPAARVSSGGSTSSGPNVTWLLLAAMLVLVVGIGAYAVRLQTQANRLQTQSAQLQTEASQLQTQVASLQATMGVLAAPDLVRIELAGQPAAPQATGRALWSRQRGMVFTASSLPPLPAGQVYQVWVVTGPAPVSAGLLTPDAAGGGTTYYSTPADIAPPTAIAVTIEPAGGLPAPTGAFYLMGTPAAS